MATPLLTTSVTLRPEQYEWIDDKEASNAQVMRDAVDHAMAAERDEDEQPA